MLSDAERAALDRLCAVYGGDPDTAGMAALLADAVSVDPDASADDLRDALRVVALAHRDLSAAEAQILGRLRATTPPTSWAAIAALLGVGSPQAAQQRHRRHARENPPPGNGRGAEAGATSGGPRSPSC
jgi:hypothetical protein